MRTFFCIPLEHDVREGIASVAASLRSKTACRCSWVRPQNYHVTVRFLGEIDPMLTVDLEALAMNVASHYEPFDLPFDRVGAFPSADRARVVWIGGDTPSAFADLVGELNTGLTELGFERERKRPVSHVTVARVKSRPDEGLVQAVTQVRPEAPLVCRADRIVLMSSDLAPGGAVYTPLFERTIGG